jgi:hypothetical protein
MARPSPVDQTMLAEYLDLPMRKLSLRSLLQGQRAKPSRVSSQALSMCHAESCLRYLSSMGSFWPFHAIDYASPKLSLYLRS